MCERCGLEEDTLHHRIWRCQDEEVKVVRNKFADNKLQRMAKDDGPSDSWYNYGIMEHIEQKLMGVPEDMAEYTTFHRRDHRGQLQNVEDRAQWRMYGSIFTDGSFTRRFNPELNRAAWAAVQVDETGATQAVVQGVVPRTLPQTPQSAEYMAATAAIDLLDENATLHIDCKGVVDTIQAAKRRQTQP